MPPPSKLAIATSSVQRLVKEEASYHKELVQQEARIAKLEKGSDDENAEYQMKQERKALEETRAVIPTVKERIQAALTALEQQLEINKAEGAPADTEQVAKAKEVVAAAYTAIREVS
ncbi:tubulin binding cofactor A [Trichodelitschia bisporula]|uniref:Tubulin-specific chaperone A n=1 Tax=Trichodelitschia bisporula TaxID=703511 RepID=A0A6G1I1F6_9PEZI|nr:tubulin binding cofactor A [Trichodelitschia bisporula]